jgi:hypothetical protein
MSAKVSEGTGCLAATYCHAFNRCCRNAVSVGELVHYAHCPEGYMFNLGSVWI